MSGSTYLPSGLPSADDVEPSKPARLNWPDNARALAAVMICSAHFMWPFRDPGDVWSLLWVLTWPFRLPVLVLLAGYFSSPRFSKAGLKSILRNLVCVFLIFTFLHALLDWWIKGSFNFKILDPYMGLWFLLSLALWRLTLPLVRSMPGILVLSFVAAALIGLAPDQVEAWPIVRTFTLWPLFLIGATLRSDVRYAKALRLPVARVVGATILVAWFGAVLANVERLRSKPLALDSVFSTSGEALLGDIGLRLAIVVGGALLAVSVLAIMPDRRLKYVTSIGVGSFTVYLLHPLIFRIVSHLGLYEWAVQWWQILAVVTGSVVLAVLLASSPVRALVRPLVYPAVPRWIRRG